MWVWPRTAGRRPAQPVKAPQAQAELPRQSRPPRLPLHTPDRPPWSQGKACSVLLDQPPTAVHDLPRQRPHPLCQHLHTHTPLAYIRTGRWAGGWVHDNRGMFIVRASSSRPRPATHHRAAQLRLAEPAPGADAAARGPRPHQRRPRRHRRLGLHEGERAAPSRGRRGGRGGPRRRAGDSSEGLLLMAPSGRPRGGSGGGHAGRGSCCCGCVGCGACGGWGARGAAAGPPGRLEAGFGAAEGRRRV